MDKILHLDQSLPTPFNFGLGLELHVVKYTGRISICHKNQQFSTIFIVNMFHMWTTLVALEMKFGRIPSQISAVCENIENNAKHRVGF